MRLAKSTHVCSASKSYNLKPNESLPLNYTNTCYASIDLSMYLPSVLLTSFASASPTQVVIFHACLGIFLGGIYLLVLGKDARNLLTGIRREKALLYTVWITRAGLPLALAPYLGH